MKNARISVFFLLLVLLLTFFSRKIFIECLGTEIVGLTATLQNILGFLNLAELGIVSAIASTLYKPLYENDQDKIKDIISIYGYLYRIIGFVILGFGMLLACFLPLFFKNTDIPMGYVYGGYFTYLLTSLIGYFISYRQTLLDADQKQYVIVAVTNFANIGKLIFQIVCLKFLGGSYLHWLGIELVFGLIFGFWINHKVNVNYPWLKTSYLRGKSVRKHYGILFTTIKNVIPHKFSTFVLYQTSGILIYAFSSLSMVTNYTNYTMILTKAVFIINTTFNGVGGSIGNLIAEGKKADIMKVFWELHFIFFLIASILVIVSFYLVEPFISLWLGDNFLLSRPVFYLILLNTFMSVVRNPVGLYLNGYVLFKDVWAPVAEALINLGIAIGAGFLWGITGVLLGSTIGLLVIVMGWKPYFLYREAFKEKVWGFWTEFMKYLLITIATWFVIDCFVSTDLYVVSRTWGSWVWNAMILSLLTGLCYSIFAYFFCKGGKPFIARIFYFLFH